MFPGFVINLDRRQERFSKFMAQPGVKDLAIERLSAVFWKDIKIPPAWNTDSWGPGGGYATTISHRNAIAEAKKRNYPAVIIFEDDAIVPAWFNKEVERFHSHLPEDWDLVFFGGVHERSPWPDCFPKHISGPVYQGFKASQLECYMLNAKAYDAALAALDYNIQHPCGWPSSAFLRMQDKLQFYVPLNLHVSQPIGWCGSDNWNHSVDRNWAKNRALIEGWFTDQEGIQYLEECMKFPGEAVVELGTWMGRSASWVAEWIHSHQGAFHCVDLWEMWERPRGRTPFQDFEWYMWKANLLDKINIKKMDTVEAASDFADESVAIVMFDSHHTEEQLTREIEVWMPKVKPGGVLCGHDYNYDHHRAVTNVVNRYFGKPKRLKDWFWAVDK